MKWRKVAGFPKWAGYEYGHHAATVTVHDGEILVWVEGPQGFQQVTKPVASNVKSAKQIAEFAHVDIWREPVVMVAAAAKEEANGN